MVETLFWIAILSSVSCVVCGMRWRESEKRRSSLQKMEERFLESEGKFSLLVENAPSGILLCETDGRIVYANAAFSHLVGVGSPSDLVGVSYLDLVHPEDREESQRRMGLLLERKPLPVRLHRLVGREPTTRLVESTGAIIFHGGLRLVMAIYHDVTEQKMAEEALRKSEGLFRSFFEQHSVGFGITDGECRWLSVNDRLCEMLGYSREELQALSWRDITPADVLDREIPAFESAMKMRVWDNDDIEKQYVRKDGTLVDVAVSTKILRSSGEAIHFASAVRDITEQKRASRMLEEKGRELVRHQEAIINGMAILAELRDSGTGKHLERTKSYVRLLLRCSGAERFYPPEDFDVIVRSSALHDIGKVGIPDHILLKPGPLTDEEFDVVRTHPIIGGRALSEASKSLGEGVSLKYPWEIVEYHHEKWDGSGYPFGLRGESIPFSARIMAVADVYDALISERAYKKARSHEDAVKIIASEAGRHFDPELVGVFLDNNEQFYSMSQEIGLQ